MAPMRHRYDTRLHKRSSGYGRPMAPRADNEMAPGYGTNVGSGQSGGGQAYDNGQYHAGGKQAGQGTQQGSSYGSSQGNQQNQQGSSRQGSSGAGSYEGSQRGSQQNTGSYGERGSGQQNQASQQNTGSYEQAGSSQQNSGYYGKGGTSQQNSGSYGQSGASKQNSGYSGQSGSNNQNAAGQQSQQESPNDGSYQSNQKGAAQQQSSPDTPSNNGYQSNSSPQNGQESHNEAAGSSYGNVNNAHGLSAQQQKAQANSNNYGSLLSDPNSAEKNESPYVANHDSLYASQLENTLKPSLATDSLLPTDSATATITASSSEPTTSTSSPTSSLTESATSSPTSSPATSSSASATATPEPTSNGLTAYQSACAGFGVALGVLVIAGVFLGWLYRRRRQQQKADSATTEQFHDGGNNAAGSTKPRPSEKLHSTFHDGMSSVKTSAAKKGHKARSSVSSAKKRASSLYGSFVGTAIGTGSGALGAVRKSLQRVPNMQQQANQTIHEDGVRSSNEEGANSVESHEQGPRDWNSTDKGNASTPTLVVSPTEGAARDMSPTVRHVPSGRPQMERSASVDDRAGISTTPETDASQGDNQTGTVSPPRGQNLLAITSMVPFLSSQYRVEIAFSAKKPGQLDLREGQCVTIRQSYDDGWVSSPPSSQCTRIVC